MLIHREGSNANHGVRSIALNASVASFNLESGRSELRQEVVRDFTTPANHDYTIELSVRELGMLIQTLAGAATDESFEKIAAPLQGSLKDLLRIAAACAPSGADTESPS